MWLDISGGVGDGVCAEFNGFFSSPPWPLQLRACTLKTWRRNHVIEATPLTDISDRFHTERDNIIADIGTI